GAATPTERDVTLRGGRLDDDTLLLTLLEQDEGRADVVDRAQVLSARSDARRLAVLQRVTAAPMSTDTVEEAATIILEELFQAKPLVAGVVTVLDEDPDWLRLAAGRGLSETSLARYARIPLTMRALPVVVATRTGRPEFLSSREEVL